ncbi:hypothetical protein [Xylella fastidiosa]|uniref:hypothetical protein n=1 Tax=Xylella fastidiosa TaxID=2371 RepID=UPI0012BD5A6D|nr:hypothetical protein [Xylella fastidiosa]MDC7969879.1 hypothetical protein [Xylella fastidiosa subsp. multiplex]QTX27655.1 hypothetical protein KBP49_08905 [Xylella fastidiosa subsp. multiplex]UIT40921.1 hypothetical protein LZ759_09150 [Xylella fastidiosa subsp. multiplex]WDF06674.1 hypothetical protein PT012_09510 [Xylella fastidiosa subsp. multiplex]
MTNKNHLKRYPTKGQGARGKGQGARGKGQGANTSLQPIQTTTQCPSLKHAPYRTSSTHRTPTNHTAHTPAIHHPME